MRPAYRLDTAVSYKKIFGQSQKLKASLHMARMQGPHFVRLLAVTGIRIPRRRAQALIRPPHGFPPAAATGPPGLTALADSKAASNLAPTSP